jgi:hypothetical protein
VVRHRRSPRWRFPSLDAIERFLATAEIISDRPLGTGRSGPRKLVLEQDGVRVAAAYNTSDTIVRGVVRQQGVTISEFHDYHLFNCAAYRLDRMLGLNRVPPTVPRDIGRMSGSVSLWIEGTFTEKDRTDRGQQPPDLFPVEPAEEDHGGVRQPDRQRGSQPGKPVDRPGTGGCGSSTTPEPSSRRRI